MARSVSYTHLDVYKRQDHGEYPLVLPTGVTIALSQSDLTDETGSLIGKLVLIHDVTHIRQLEDRLQRRNRLEAMGQMVGNIAHEIRNPLGSVELFASMLRKDLRDQPHLRTYAEHISVAVQAMDRLLSNPVSYTHLDVYKRQQAIGERSSLCVGSDRCV